MCVFWGEGGRAAPEAPLLVTRAVPRANRGVIYILQDYLEGACKKIPSSYFCMPAVCGGMLIPESAERWLRWTSIATRQSKGERVELESLLAMCGQPRSPSGSAAITALK